ncbi:LGFP repeat-containing protein [Kineococcus xinjiangensis]|uniref:LGFP repeat-containing protein n=1 Tax=Kineococcus xinjiangensis TaxID=512762 RepID=A0A2S6ISZ9_9ACTN|nr:hypothetical protein [Kineococcus xinjiangensis]PPK97300.1 LGFP repeat-containing protein [Kineococcus xinjiangensis]
MKRPLAAVAGLAVLLPLATAAPASAAAATVSGAKADPTCVVGTPGAFVWFDHRGAGSGTRFVVERNGQVVGEVRRSGDGRAGVQTGALPTGEQTLRVRAEGGGSVDVPVRVGTCDMWRDPADYNATSNRPIGVVDASQSYPVVGGQVWFGDTGELYGTPRGLHAVGGAINHRYWTMDATAGPLGLPLGSEFGLPAPRYGYYQNFERGNIYWSPRTGAHAVLGEINRRYAAMGWERSWLGLPVTSEQPTPARRGAFSHFEGGSIYWSPQKGAHAVGGAIGVEWARLGHENSWLGFPQSGEYQSGEHRRIDFEHGYLVWTPQRGVQAFRW